MQAFTQAPIYARTSGYVKAWVPRHRLAREKRRAARRHRDPGARPAVGPGQGRPSPPRGRTPRWPRCRGPLPGPHRAERRLPAGHRQHPTSQLRTANTEVTSAGVTSIALRSCSPSSASKAPFDGVITARNLDIGQLITTTGSTATSSRYRHQQQGLRHRRRQHPSRLRQRAPGLCAGCEERRHRHSQPAAVSQPQLSRYTVPSDSRPGDPHSARRGRRRQPLRRAAAGNYTEVRSTSPAPRRASAIPVSALILEPDGLHVAAVDSANHAHIVHIPAEARLRLQHGRCSGLAQVPVIANPPTRSHRRRGGARGHAREQRAQRRAGAADVPSPFRCAGAPIPPTGRVAIVPAAFAARFALAGCMVEDELQSPPCPHRRLLDGGHYGDWAPPRRLAADRAVVDDLRRYGTQRS